MKCPTCLQPLTMIPGGAYACPAGHFWSARQAADANLADALINLDVKRMVDFVDLPEQNDEFKAYVDDGTPMRRPMTEDEELWVYLNLK